MHFAGLAFSRMASIEVSVSSGKPVRFRSSDEGPAWSKVVTRLKELHGPGVLVDAEGMQVLVNVDTDDLAPAGSYEWVTPGGEYDEITSRPRTSSQTGAFGPFHADIH